MWGVYQKFRVEKNVCAFLYFHDFISSYRNLYASVRKQRQFFSRPIFDAVLLYVGQESCIASHNFTRILSKFHRQKHFHCWHVPLLSSYLTKIILFKCDFITYFCKVHISLGNSNEFSTIWTKLKNKFCYLIQNKQKLQNENFKFKFQI